MTYNAEENIQNTKSKIIITNLKSYVLIDDLLHVAADRGTGVHNLPQVQFVQRRSFSGIVQPNDHDLVLLRRKHQEPEPRKERPHLLPDLT